MMNKSFSVIIRKAPTKAIVFFGSDISNGIILRFPIKQILILFDEFSTVQSADYVLLAHLLLCFPSFAAKNFEIIAFWY